MAENRLSAAIVVVSSDAAALRALGEELAKRYSADYEIVLCGQPAVLDAQIRDLLAARIAVALGQIDHWVMRPVQTPDEDFHHAITGFLSEWGSRRGSGFEAVWVIGEQWSARSQELRDMFARNGIPIGFYDAAAPRGGQMI